jgi:phage-related minor tail protein
MDLAELKFVVDTKELETAATRVAELGTAVSKLNKPMQELTRESAKTNKELSKAEEAAAKAALAQTKLEQAQTKSTQAAAKSSSVLERQNLILEYMAQGNSKGQASILATAKAAGALDDEMLELNKTLVTQRTLIGGDPFDKSIGLMQKLQNEYKTTTEVTNLFNKNLGLTEKQMTDLAREKQRLIALYGIEGKSLDGLSAEYEQLIQKSAMINRSNDARTNSMKAQVKSQNDASKANEYLAKEIERVNRLNSEGADITSATNNRLIRFERELRASGASAAEAATKLDAYKTSLLSAQKVAGNRQIDYLSRALGPQITDIAVGLATGQAPLTILLQQGGQLRDQFALAGVAGADMGKMLIQASKSMVSSVKDVGLAIGQVFVGAVVGSGKAVTNFGMQITGTSFLLDAFRNKLVSIEGASSSAVAMFDKLGKAITLTVGGAVFAAIALLIGLAVQYSKVIAAEKELTASLAMSGAALAMSTEDAINYAESMNKVGIGTMDAMRMISEFANTGADASIPLKEIILSAQDMQKYVGIASADTMKAFADISEKPVEGLIKLAKSTGNVTAETILQAEAAVKAGNNAEAARIAQEALSNSNAEVVKRMKNNLDPLQTLWLDIKTGISQAGEAIYDFLKSSAAIAVFRTVWETISVIVTEVWYVLKQTGNEISGIFSQIKAVMSGDFAGAARIGDQMKIDAAAAREEQDKLVASIMNRNKAEKETLSVTEAQRTANRNAAKEIEDRIKKESKEGKGTKTDDGFAAALEAANKFYQGQVGAVENLTKSEIALNKVREDAKYKALSDTQKKQIDDIYEQAKANEILVKAEKDRTNQMSAIAALLGKSDGFGKQYYDTLKLLDEAYIDGNISLEKHIELVNILYHTTPQVKARQDAIEKLMQAQKKADDALFDSLDVEHQLNMQILEQTDLLALEASLIGATDAERKKALTNKRLDLQLEKEIADIKKRSISKDEQDAQIASAEQRRLEAGKNVNTEIAQDFAKKQLEEYEKIKDGVTDSIVTALFDGGKEGGKKLRAVLEAELRKEFTISVKALVDIASSGLNSLLGGVPGSTLTGTIASKIGGISMGGTTLAAGASAFGQGVLSGFSTGAPVASMGSATSASFNAGAAAAPVAGALGGLAANKLISDGYQISKTMTDLQNVATVAAAFIPGLGPLVALGVGAVSGVANRAFGMKAKEITGEGIVGTLTTQGADVKAFEDWFQKGGWFRKNKSGRTFSAVSTSLQEYLDGSLSGLTATTKKYADALGLQSNDIDGVTKTIELNLKGLSAEDRQKKIDEALGGFGDELAKKLGLESFDALQKLGEQVLQQRYDLETQLLTLQGDTNELRKRERDQIYETNQALFDQIKALEDKKAADEEAVRAMEKLTSVTTTIVDEINRLRGVDTSKSGLEAEFAILTAQARSGDLEALAKLPDVTKGLEQLAISSAVNATDVVMARARLAQSLQDTLGYTGGLSASPTAVTSMSGLASVSTGSSASTVSASSSNQELLSALVTEVQGLRAEVRADVSHNAKTAKILERVNQDGESLTITTLV